MTDREKEYVAWLWRAGTSSAAHDIVGQEEYCEKCGVTYVPIITAPPVPETVSMDLVRKRQ